MSTPKPTLQKPIAESRFAFGFLRRLAAIFYDLCLLIALLFVATALILPFNSGEAFSSSNIFYPLYLLGVSFVFYGWFWTHGGQTLGLRAWRLRVLTFDKQPISWKQATLRFCCALLSCGLFGLGLFWLLIDKNGRAWHDSWSKTAVFLIKKD